MGGENPGSFQSVKDRSICENDNHFAHEMIDWFGVAIRNIHKLVLEASDRQQRAQWIINGAVRPQRPGFSISAKLERP